MSNEPQVEIVTDPDEIQALQHFRTRRSRNELRDLVWREIVKTADAKPKFRAVVEPIGFFSFMELVDGICDAVTVVADPEPLPEWHCPACGATTRARMADRSPTPTLAARRGTAETGDDDE